MAADLTVSEGAKRQETRFGVGFVLTVGEHTLTIEEDYWLNRVGESDEANNATTVTFTVVSGDLVV